MSRINGKKTHTRHYFLQNKKRQSNLIKIALHAQPTHSTPIFVHPRVRVPTELTTCEVGQNRRSLISPPFKLLLRRLPRWPPSQMFVRERWWLYLPWLDWTLLVHPVWLSFDSKSQIKGRNKENGVRWSGWEGEPEATQITCSTQPRFIWGSSKNLNATSPLRSKCAKSLNASKPYEHPPDKGGKCRLTTPLKNCYTQLHSTLEG